MASSPTNNLLASLILGASLAYGLGAIGRSLAGAVETAHAAQRTVSVKGLSEREVSADLAIWPLTFVDANSDLAELQQTLDSHHAIIIKFLKARGFTDAEISESAPAITDNYAQDHNAAAMNRPRYSAQATVTLRTSRVKLVDDIVRNAGELVKQGIVLSGGYGGGAQYFFTRLNDVKPSMIAQATQNARKAAEQFAKDSHSSVGSIRTAQQGLFSIEDRDQYTPQLKKVRVVTTVDYFLAGQ
jgi:hypothetical protein